jgi:DNA polymerase-3 subunit epsilon
MDISDFDQNILHNRFVILDFETVTPKGRSPLPIELGALMLGPDLKQDASFSFEKLMSLPKGIEMNSFEINQTGILPKDLEEKEPPEKVLADFNDLFENTSYIYVAQFAKYDYSVLKQYPTIVPHVVNSPFIDTIKLAQFLIPFQSSYKLDALAKYFSIELPLTRHRAMIDVEITLEVLRSLILLGLNKKFYTTQDLLHIAGINIPRKKKIVSEQIPLF